MTERLTDYKVEMLIGQTPCLCGDCETWHQDCYRGKSDEQIDAEYRIAYRKARAWIKTRAALIANRAITNADAKGKP